MPVRDAIRTLLYEGLLEATSRGVRVTRITRRDLTDAFRVEALLHSLASVMVTERARDADIETLKCLNNEMTSAYQCGDEHFVDEFNERFHRTINQLAESPRLVAAIRVTSVGVQRVFVHKFSSQTPLWLQDHVTILNAMFERDKTSVYERMKIHVERSIENLNMYLQGADNNESQDC
jgi:DNA-binding GntR family transcriptional regulator